LSLRSELFLTAVEYDWCSSRIPAWRAVSSTTLAFAYECFVDEMAVKAGKDPMKYQQEMAKGGSDLAKILTKLCEVSKWDRPLATGKGRGVAQYEFFAGHAGSVVEVFKQGESLKIDKVYGVIDMGTVVKPGGVEEQVQSALPTAITAATKKRHQFRKRKKQNNPATTYPNGELHHCGMNKISYA
jgi:isoquinoline 1-oxidoreductase beta subunit